MCVPLFFMVNGALMLNKGYSLNNHAKKIIRTIIIIFIWGAIQLLLYIPVKHDTYTARSFFDALITWKQGRINPLWFLHTIVCFYIFFPIIKEIFDKKDNSLLKYFTVVIGIFTFGLVFLNMGVNVLQWLRGSVNLNFFDRYIEVFNPFKGFYSYSFIYFIFGGVLFNKLKENKIKLRNISVIMILLVSLTLATGYGVIMTSSNGALYGTVWGGYDIL